MQGKLNISRNLIHVIVLICGVLGFWGFGVLGFWGWGLGVGGWVYLLVSTTFKALSRAACPKTSYAFMMSFSLK